MAQIRRSGARVRAVRDHRAGARVAAAKIRRVAHAHARRRRLGAIRAGRPASTARRRARPGHTILDPSRVAAQVVSGIGFIGGGLIFVRQDMVLGLTTAAIVWVTCAIGMACGAGLALLAIVVTAAHFVVVFLFPAIAARLPVSGDVPYRGSESSTRTVAGSCARSSVRLRTRDSRSPAWRPTGRGGRGRRHAPQGRGRKPVEDLAVVLDGLDGVLEVSASNFGSARLRLRRRGGRNRPARPIISSPYPSRSFTARLKPDSPSRRPRSRPPPPRPPHAGLVPHESDHGVDGLRRPLEHGLGCAIAIASP